jgi:hypothetical protein
MRAAPIRNQLLRGSGFALGIDDQVLDAAMRLLEELAEGAAFPAARVGLDQHPRDDQPIEVHAVAIATDPVGECRRGHGGQFMPA